nr:hypothetical protein [Tanacetum cinerariifolium]
TQFPGQAGVADAAERRGARAAVVARDENYVGVRLGYAGRDGTHARLTHQLHVDAGGAVGVFEVENQLGQVLDGVDVVVRRRRNEAYAGRGRVFAALAGIALAADAVHGDGQRAVRLVRNRAKRHRARRKPLHDALNRLHFFQCNAGPVLGKTQQPANGEQLVGMLVEQLGVLLIGVVLAGARSVLQQVNRLRVKHVRLALAPPL